MLAFWNEIKEAVTQADATEADEYWTAMKGAGLPPTEKVPSGKFKGKLISATPARQQRVRTRAADQRIAGTAT